MLRRVAGPSTLGSSSSARRNVHVTTCKRDDMTAVASNHTSTSLHISVFHDRLRHVLISLATVSTGTVRLISPRRRYHRSLKHNSPPYQWKRYVQHRTNYQTRARFSHPSTKFREAKHRSAGHWNFSTFRLGMLGPNESRLEVPEGTRARTGASYFIELEE